MTNENLTDIIKQRDEKILKNLSIAKQREESFCENSLEYILTENKNRIRGAKHIEKNLINKNRILKELENKLMEQDKFKRN